MQCKRSREHPSAAFCRAVDALFDLNHEDIEPFIGVHYSGTLEIVIDFLSRVRDVEYEREEYMRSAAQGVAEAKSLKNSR